MLDKYICYLQLWTQFSLLWLWKVGNEEEIYVLYMIFHKILFIFIKIDDQPTTR